jgi:hypothetical protein
MASLQDRIGRDLHPQKRVFPHHSDDDAENVILSLPIRCALSATKVPAREAPLSVSYTVIHDAPRLPLRPILEGWDILVRQTSPFVRSAVNPSAVPPLLARADPGRHGPPVQQGCRITIPSPTLRGVRIGELGMGLY